jgi:hypothetical protein
MSSSRVLSQRLARQKDEAERMAALKKKMIQRINTAQPKLTTRSLLIPGIGGPLAKADEDKITVQTAAGKPRTVAWDELRPKSVQRLVGYTAKSAEDHLAGGVLLLTLSRVAQRPSAVSSLAASAEDHFGEAKAEGADIARYLDPLAESAFARVKSLLEKARGMRTSRPRQMERFAEAEKALAAIEDKYADTPWFREHKDAVQAAQNEVAAEKLYAQAASLYAAERLFDLKPLVEKLAADYAETAPATDPDRKPSFAEMREATKDLGTRLIVRKDGKGDFRSIQAAVDAAPPNSIIEIADSGVYDEKIKMADMTLRGRPGLWPIIRYTGSKRTKDPLLALRGEKVTLEGLVAVSTQCTCIGSSARHTTLRRVIANGRWGGGGAEVTGTLGARGEVKVILCLLVGRGTKVEGGRFMAEDSILPLHAGGGILRNTVILRIGPTACSSGGEIRNCTFGPGVQSLKLGRGPDLVIDSVVTRISAEADPTTGPTRIEHCNVYGKAPFWEDAKPGKGCFSAPPEFRDPRNLDYRLKRDSPCRGKASDGGDIGCRYTKEMLEVLKKALELRKKGIIKF